MSLVFLTHKEFRNKFPNSKCTLIIANTNYLSQLRYEMHYPTKTKSNVILPNMYRIGYSTAQRRI